MYPYAVDPTRIPKNLSTKQVEFFILFAILVAGKGASQTFRKLNSFLSRIAESTETGRVPSPFEIIRYLVETGTLGAELEAERFGQYRRIVPAIEQAVAVLDTDFLTLEALESIPGIGPKTARFVMLYVDPRFNGVPLDTHILKFLKAQGLGNVPSSTPPAGPLYKRLERDFVTIAEAEGLTVRQLDTAVWKSYNEKKPLDLSVYRA